jgi:hypothetical protein
MSLPAPHIAAALDAVQQRVASADTMFSEWCDTDDEWAGGAAEWHAQLAYQDLLILSELLQLPALRAEILSAREASSAVGLREIVRDPDQDPHMACLAPVRRFLQALQAILVIEPARSVTKDIEAILRGCEYAITDKDAFAKPPADEAEVHNRIEAVLRCMFTDLIRKPRLHKPIKNFEPDTGIPSLKTLIEYKFLSSKDMAPKIADEILADTRAYASPTKEWTSFIYVIYETKRFKTELEWRQLLRECEVSTNSSVIVLSGEDPQRKKSKTPKALRAKP